jgi:ABC-type phosphate transport system substrate-binding protein
MYQDQLDMKPRRFSGRRIMVATVLLGIFLLSVAAAQTSRVKVVIHPSSSLDSVTRKDLTRIFLKQRSSWGTGDLAKPIDQKPTSEVRIAFTEEVLGKSIREIESHWNAQVFSGKSSPPRMVGTDEEVLEFVRSNPGAVGYVSADTATDGVKILSITE